MSGQLSPNALALIALCNEFCQAAELAAESTCDDFTATMTRLLPRIYISAQDVPVNVLAGESYIPASLDEDYYDAIRRNIETVLGENDTYLEVFEQDMKFSDTPIGASVAESLADLFQVFYNFINAIKDAPDDIINECLNALSEDFAGYWSQILVNVMRPLNAIRHHC